MKMRVKKTLSAFLCVLTVLTSVFVFSAPVYSATPVNLEGSTFGIWADPNNVLSQDKIESFSDDKLSTLGGIKPFKNSTLSTALYYLFLPSNTDCNSLTFWFSGTMTIDGIEITSGVPTDVLSSIDNGGVSERFTFVDNGRSHTVVCMKSGDVGSVFIDTVSGSVKDVYSSSDHSVGEAGSVMVVQPDGTVDYMGDLEKIQGRGNTTWSTSSEKNPFNIKLAKSAKLLGMNKSKKWVLLANASDDTLLKNQITYDFAKYVGVKYQPVCKPVDLYVNQQYYGSYQLSERIEIKPGRIDISDAYDNLRLSNAEYDSTGAIVSDSLEGTPVNSVSAEDAYNIGSKKYSDTLKDPVDITGGYLYELEVSDRWIKENAGFCAYNKQCWVLKNCDYASQGMVDYSYDLLFALGASLYNDGIVPSTATEKLYTRGKASNPAPAEKYHGMKWSDLLDSDSAVRYYLVEELFKNLDASTTSCYFFKDSDMVNSKLYAGPVWDMDKSFGYTGTRWGSNIGLSTGWYAKNVRIYKYNSTSDLILTDSNDLKRPLAFLGQLCTQEDFWEDVERYWSAYFIPAVDVLTGKRIDETKTLKSLDEYGNTISKSAQMNTLRFSVTGLDSYNAEANIINLSYWISSRQEWISSQVSEYDDGIHSVLDDTGESEDGSETIASWNYDHLYESDALVPAENACQYTATGGRNMNTSFLTASVNAADTAEIKWSGALDLYNNDGAVAQAPIMGTSKTNLLAWGEYPYFETAVSTIGYDDIRFSSKLGGTKKAPRDWKLQYSLDGINYKDAESTYSIKDNKTMEQAFSGVLLPDECENTDKLYIRMAVCADTAINGTDTIVGQLNGDAAVNNIKITGVPCTHGCRLTVKAVSKEHPTDTAGTKPIDAVIRINGSECSLTNGRASVWVVRGEVNTVEVSLNGKTFVEKKEIAVSEDTEITVPIVPLDYVADGIINGKDFVYIRKQLSTEDKSYFETLFPNYMNYK